MKNITLSFVTGPSQCEFLDREIMCAAHLKDYVSNQIWNGWISKELEKWRLNRNESEETTKIIHDKRMLCNHSNKDSFC